jgi:dienelactone hydrolase
LSIAGAGFGYCLGVQPSLRSVFALRFAFSPRSGVLALCAFLLTTSQAFAQRYVERQIRIPWTSAGPAGLDALLVYVDLPGKHPLVVLTHGSARNKQDHALVSPWQQLPQALWFARRGWVALVVVRRGYGTSGGDQDGNHGGHCGNRTTPDYEAAGTYAAEDLRTAIDYSRSLPQVDDTRIVAAGISTGGFTTVALTVNPPRGLVAGINFAGGRGSQGDHDVCDPGDLISAYRAYGKRSRVPMLWIYSENDKFFWPELAQKFDAAFRSGGGQDQFVLAPPDGEDGHHLFSHIEAWSPTVDAFLSAQNLAPLAELLPEVQPPNIPPPPGLSEDGVAAFRKYLILGPHKAFAVSGSSFGFSTGRMTVGEAREKAVDSCKHSEKSREACKVVSVDGAPVGP